MFHGHEHTCHALLHHAATKQGKVKTVCLEFRMSTSPEAKTVEEYCTFHDTFMRTYLVEHEHDNKRRLFLFYDIRGCACREFMNVIQPFIAIHNKYREDYKTHLIGTVIACDNVWLTGVVNTLFSTIYFPARPIRLVTSGVTEAFELLWDTR